MRDIYETEREKNLRHYISREQIIYRRAYYDGFLAARMNRHISQHEIKHWAYSLDDPFPPGSPEDKTYQQFLDEESN